MIANAFSFLSGPGFMPHGHCYLWEPAVLWPMAASDGLIALSYLVISVSLVYLIRRIRLPYHGIFAAFGLFIAACGAGHLIDVVTLWFPVYRMTAAVRVITAAASVVTAVLLVRLLPKMIHGYRAMTGQLAEMERRVAERTQEYQELVNTVDGVVWEAQIDKPGYTFVSRQAERIFGYPLEQWMGEQGFWQNILHPDDRDRLNEERYRRLDGRQDSQIEYRVLTAQRKIVWVRDHVTVIFEKGRPVKLRGVLVDISDLKEAEARMHEAQLEAIEAARVKSDFLANMSHEIRTPLNAIIGMATLGLDLPMTAEQEDGLRMIKGAADSLLTLINDILDFSKIEAGKIELEVCDYNLNSLCRNAAELIAPVAKAKDVAFDTRLEPGLPLDLRGDPSRLLQILVNLLSNAVKFTSAGGSVELRVFPSALPSGAPDKLVFEVNDTGVGISEEAKARLFVPFSQGDASTARRFGGTGLGLSICKHLADLMKGEISLESAPGRGSVFRVVLPIHPASAPVLDEGTEAQAPRPPRDRKQSRILVVEDNPANQKVVLRYLEKLGYAAEAVADGREAIAAFRRGIYDLMLMDCQMPELDGYEATRRIRELEARFRRHPTPIVALTAHALSGDREKCRAAGMDDYLSKPIGIEQLERTIERHLKGKQPAKSPDGAFKVAEPPKTAWHLQPMIDFEFLKGLDSLQEKGKPDLVRELIDYFSSSGPTTMRKIRAAIESADHDKRRKAAHGFKSTCYNVGALRLAAICEEIERHPENDAPKSLLESLEDEYDSTSSELKAVLARRA